jgi:hypothetical protein
MGILKSGILGPMTNKTGPVSGRMYRGVNVLSAAHRKSNKPTTALQIDAQAKFGLLNSFLSDIENLVRIGFKQFAKGKDPLNVAYSYNYGYAFLSTATALELNYPELVYSRGYILPPESPAILALPAQIEFNWLPQRQSNHCQFTDLATVMVYNPTKKHAFKKIGITDRYEQGYLMDLPLDYAGDIVHCYMSFASKDGKMQGNSMYLGQVLCVE